MKKKINLLGVFILLLVNVNAQTPYFYYYNGEKQYLELDTRHIFVSMANESAINTLASKNLKHQPLRADIHEKTQPKNGHKRFWTVLDLEDKLSNEAYLAKIVEIKKAGKGMMVAPYFKMQQKDKIGLSNFFLVKLKSLNDTVLLKQEIEKENAIIVYQDDFMPLWFVASITERSKHNAMETANRLYETGLFQHAVPDLMEEIELNSVNDQYFDQQWGLKNTGQNGGTSGIDIKACDAWQISTGSNITVAVFDQGIYLTHPDLSANIHPLSFDCDNLTMPQVVRGSHGVTCAGIIGAVSNNTIGIAGVAPNCKLMSVSSSMVGTPLLRLRRADGINWAWQNGADVISNSWRSFVQYPEIDDAINNALTQGRNGKGCIVVFASGNDNRSVNYPANANSNILVVGAISPCGERKNPNSCDGENWGSSYGPELDIVAPGVLIPTTDRQGNYKLNFNGTSAACPHVAGVAALVLSVNPALTAQQVRDIIEKTAQKVGNYTYANTAGRPNGTWHEEMGYGLVNADAAVKAACETATIYVGDHVSYCNTNEYIKSNYAIVVSGVFEVSGYAKVSLLTRKKVEINHYFEVRDDGAFEVFVDPDLPIVY